MQIYPTSARPSEIQRWPEPGPFRGGAVRFTRLLALLLCSLAPLAWGQVDLPDAGLPDASVGGTGSERASEEEEDSINNPCLSDLDCDRGLQCLNNRCTWRAWREATQEGCSAAPGAMVLLCAALLGRYFLVNLTK
jgi:hypothetical protein